MIISLDYLQRKLVMGEPPKNSGIADNSTSIIQVKVIFNAGISPRPFNVLSKLSEEG